MNNIYFFLIAMFGMYIFRKIGWIFSRTVLYNPKISNLSTAFFCIIWAILTAILVHLSILWQQPNIVMKIIFGYILGAYVSIPNFGLVDESTIPIEKIHHHKLIGNISVVSYILSIILIELFF